MRIPERELNPPLKLVDVAHCPECGSEDLSVVFLEKTWNRIYSWDGKEPGETQVDEEIIVKDLGYYCPICEAEFPEPDWRKELG